MRIASLLLLTAGSLLTGCLDMGSAPEREESPGKAAQDAGPVAARITSGGHKYFKMHNEYQSNAGAGTERYKDCDENGVLIGFGGRVDGSSNFTDLTVYCRDIDPFGALGGVYTRTAGGTSQEDFVVADPGFVVVAVAGRVGNNNLEMAVIRQCEWDPDARAINPAACNHKYGNGSGSWEQYYGAYLSDPQYPAHPYQVLTGVGLTATNSNLAAIRISLGLLRPMYTYVQAYPVSVGAGGYVDFTYQLVDIERWTAFTTYGGTGDVWMLVKKGSPPTPQNFDYSSLWYGGSQTREAVEIPFFDTGVYYIRVYGITNSSGMTFAVKWSRG